MKMRLYPKIIAVLFTILSLSSLVTSLVSAADYNVYDSNVANPSAMNPAAMSRNLVIKDKNEVAMEEMQKQIDELEKKMSELETKMGVVAPNSNNACLLQTVKYLQCKSFRHGCALFGIFVQWSNKSAGIMQYVNDTCGEDNCYQIEPKCNL